MKLAKNAARRQVPKFYNLITDFKKLSGVPVILNTSFNDNGEPIVNTPEDALSSFKRTNLDILAIGNFVIHKENV